MHFEDDRTESERASHRWLVVATDRFMSGWGGAAGGTSVAAWACRSHREVEQCAKWVRKRSEMRNVRVIRDSYDPYKRAGGWSGRKGAAHVHIYVVDEGHPSLAGGDA